MAEQLLSDAKKEQIKLRATFLNNIGIGAILIGVFTPIIRAIYEPTMVSGNLISVSGTMVICFSLGWALHLLANAVLRGLNK